MPDDPVGPEEIAERLGVRRDTVHKWRHRGVLPEPDWIISSLPVWEWETIRAWAENTGRLEP